MDCNWVVFRVSIYIGEKIAGHINIYEWMCKFIRYYKYKVFSRMQILYSFLLILYVKENGMQEKILSLVSGKDQNFKIFGDCFCITLTMSKQSPLKPEIFICIIYPWKIPFVQTWQQWVGWHPMIPLLKADNTSYSSSLFIWDLYEGGPGTWDTSLSNCS